MSPQIARTCNRHGDSPQRTRLRAALLDQLPASAQQPLHLPTPRTSPARADFFAAKGALRGHGVEVVQDDDQRRLRG